MKKKVYAYLHTHWDREWYRNKEEFNLRLIEVFDIVLDELKNNNAPFFYLDGQVIALLDYLKYREEKTDLIKNLISQKKLAIGPYFVSADTFLVNYMSMLKNIDLGLKISKEFGQKEFIGYLSDVFGISKSAFCALKEKKIDKALIWRGVNPEKINSICNFKYENINTTWLAQGYFNDLLHNENIPEIKKYLDKISKYSPDCCLLPIGGDHLGILKNANQIIKNINKKLTDYEIILTSPFEYFKKTKYNNTTKEKEFLDNKCTYILPGVYSARIPQKIKNCIVQNKLSRIIEPLNFYLEDKFKKNIEEIYQTLIKNHAHDGIYGCSIDEVHGAIDARLNKCNDISNAILKRLIGNFKKKYKINGISKNKIGLFNLSNSNNLKTIKIKLPYLLKNSQLLSYETGFCDELLYDVYKIPVTEDIQKIYTQLVEISGNNKFEFNTLKIKKANKNVFVNNNQIENKNIKIEIKNKKIEILNKKTKDILYLNITDIQDIGDSYNFAPKGQYKTLDLTKTKIIYDGEIESCLRLYFKDIELDLILNNHSEFIQFSANINNKKKNHKLQVVLKSKNNIAKSIAQDAFGIIERKIDCNYKMQDFMPAKRPTELKTNSFPMQNFVCTNNFYVLTKGLNEYEIYKNELRICLLRCFSTISNPKNPTRAIPAGPDLKTPDAQCIGKYKMDFAIGFGNYKKAFKNLDIFFENYTAIDGEFKNNIKLTFEENLKDAYFYGINKNKKIIYNLQNF